MKRQSTWKKLILILVLLLLSLSAWAQDSEESSGVTNTEVFNLGQVVVQGKGETVTQVSTVDTVDKIKIEQIGAQNLTEALDAVPGINVSIGGGKAAKNFTVRGFNQRYVPIFFDGIPLYLPFEGSVDGGMLTISNASQITVTKGIASVLYGPNTMGGVINIVSMKPKKSVQGDYKTELTGDSQRIFNLNLGSNLGKFYFTAGAGKNQADHYNVSDEFEPARNEDGGRRENSDFDQRSKSFKVGFVPKEGHEYALGYNEVSNHGGMPLAAYDTNARYWRWGVWEKQTTYLLGDSSLTDKLSLKTRLFHDEYRNIIDGYTNNTYLIENMHSTYDDHGDGVILTLRSSHLNKNTLSGSFYYKDDVHTEQDSRTAKWDVFEAETLSYGLEDDIKFADNLAAVIGASYDIQKTKYADGGPLRDDESTFNPQAGINWNVRKGTRLHFGVAQKSRFPTLFELYSEQFGRNVKNLNLATEKGVNYEAGIEQELPAATRLGLNLFYSDVEDLIVRKQLPSPPANTYQYQNIGQASFSGFELNLRTGYLKNNDLEMSYTYLDAEDESPNRISDHLPDTSNHKLYITDLYKMNEILSLFCKVEYNSKRWYYDNRSMLWSTLDSYWTADTKLIAALSPKTSFELGVRNLLDGDYSNAYGYPRAGRTFFMGVKGTF